MYLISLVFYFLVFPCSYGVDYDQDLILDDDTLTLSDGIQLHEVSPSLFAKTADELEMLASELSDLKETFQYFQEFITTQQTALNTAENKIQKSDEKIQQAIEHLEKSLAELPETPADNNKSELILLTDEEKEDTTHPTLPTEHQRSTLLTKENGIATTIATAGGLAAFGVSQIFAAPVTLTVAAIIGTSALGFGGTKFHYNKDSLPSLSSLIPLNKKS